MRIPKISLPVTALIKAASLIAAMILTAQTEHHFAVLMGFKDPYAWLFPAAVDLYATAAFRAGARRDIAAAVWMMIITQSLAHLVEANVLAPQWWMVVVTSAVIPVTMWRVHVLKPLKKDTAEFSPKAETAIPAPVAAPVPARTAHPLPWPTRRAEPVLADIAAAPAPAASLNPPAPVATVTANRAPRKTREERLTDLRAVILARPTIDQTTAARHMGITDRYIRGLFAGPWNAYRAEVLATA